MSNDPDPMTASLEAIQGFNPAMIARTEALGSMFDFTPAVPIVTQVVDFFRLIPKDLVPGLPDVQRSQVKARADACWATMQNMMSFAPDRVPNPNNERQGYINTLNEQFGEALNQLGPVVAYLTAKHRTASGVEAEARALLETARTQVETMSRLEQETTEASKRLLGEVRRLASEAGVSQQASYFGEQATKHATAASDWQKYTYITAGVLVAFALTTWILGFWISPTNNYQAVQFGVSKLLIFSTVAFILYLCARTLMAHRHNEVVNRHRQNALLTFNALADATSSPQTREVVLTHASACIYAPQESGFSKPSASGPSPSLIEVLPRLMGSGHATGA